MHPNSVVANSIHRCNLGPFFVCFIFGTVAWDWSEIPLSFVSLHVARFEGDLGGGRLEPGGRGWRLPLGRHMRQPPSNRRVAGNRCWFTAVAPVRTQPPSDGAGLAVWRGHFPARARGHEGRGQGSSSHDAIPARRRRWTWSYGSGLTGNSRAALGDGATVATLGAGRRADDGGATGSGCDRIHWK